MTITKTAHLPVSPDEAFALITEPERLRRWMTVTAHVELRAGGGYRWTITPGHIVAGTFTEVEPGKRVAFGWGTVGSQDFPPDASTVTITVEPAGSGSLVTLVHQGLTGDQETGHQEGWNHFFERLEQVAATGDAGPDAWAASPENLGPLSAAEASLAVIQGVLRKLSDEDMVKQTPCADYDGRALAEHLTGSLVGVGSMVGAEVVDPGEGTLEDRVTTMAAAVLERMHERGIDGMIDGPIGAMPAVIATHILSIEFLLHGWDFAQTSGQDVTVSDDLVAYVREVSQPIIDGSRERGAFKSEAQVGTEATPLDHLAAFSGRELS